MKHITITLLFICIAFCANAQPSQATYFIGKTSIYACEANTLINTTDGGYMIAGFTTDIYPSSQGIYLVKLDSRYKAIWTKTIDPPYSNGSSQANSIIQVKDGGYVMVGNIASLGGTDPYIVKVDSSANFKWSRFFATSSFYNDQAWGVVEANDGGYVMAGGSTLTATTSKICLVKFDSSGNMIWDKLFGGDSINNGYAITKTHDGGYAVSGYTNTFGGGIYVLKVDSGGNLLWTKVIHGTGLGYSFAQLIETKDKGLVGTSPYSLIIFKLDSAGNLKWEKNVKTGGVSTSIATSVIQTDDGGYLMAGMTNAFGAGLFDAIIVKFTSNGLVSWYKTAGAASDDELYSVLQTNDHGYLATGYSRSYPPDIHNVYILKFDSNGNTCTSSTPGPVTYDSTTLTGSGGTVMVYGFLYDSNATVFTISSVDSDLCNVLTSAATINAPSNSIEVFPNPFTNSTTISIIDNGQLAMDNYLEIYGLTGQIIKHLEFTGNSYTLSAEGLAKGMYFVRVLDKDRNVIGTTKIVVQ